jgi:DNA topoisomerase-1
MKVLIVESPTKAKTIRKFLKGYFVLATYGHLLDLPSNSFGIYLKNGKLLAKYVPVKGKNKTIKKIKEIASKAKEIILATDPDREGEMIAKEVQMILPEKEHKKIKRIFLHEIIPSALFQALKNLSEIKESLVNAQKGRRYLDRIFGYSISPLLWKIEKNLSAGRVQSSALRIIIEREEEIKNFKKKEYFQIYLVLENFPLKAVLIRTRDDTNLYEPKTNQHEPSSREFVSSSQKFAIWNLSKEELEKIKKEIFKIKNLILEKIIEEKKKIYPPLPLDTENAQRFAYQFLKFPPKKTMFILQKLFESGFITYHRTDSHHINKNFSLKIKNFICENYGESYFSFPRYKKEKISFEAHEAIRPTSLEKPNLAGDFLKLWQLIFMITISSHFKPLEYLETKYIFSSNNYYFLAINKSLIFDGFGKVYPIKEKFLQKIDVKEGESFSVLDFEIKKIETKPPPRFTEASLIKKMKELGIGRPSTYVPIIEILKKRKYVIKEKSFLKPTDLGYQVYQFLKENYPELVDLKFTALMEEKLDEIALNKLNYEKFVIDFWEKLGLSAPPRLGETS